MPIIQGLRSSRIRTGAGTPDFRAAASDCSRSRKAVAVGSGLSGALDCWAPETLHAASMRKPAIDRADASDLFIFQGCHQRIGAATRISASAGEQPATDVGLDVGASSWPFAR